MTNKDKKGKDKEKDKSKEQEKESALKKKEETDEEKTKTKNHSKGKQIVTTTTKKQVIIRKSVHVSSLGSDRQSTNIDSVNNEGGSIKESSSHDHESKKPETTKKQVIVRKSSLGSDSHSSDIKSVKDENKNKQSKKPVLIKKSPSASTNHGSEVEDDDAGPCKICKKGENVMGKRREREEEEKALCHLCKTCGGLVRGKTYEEKIKSETEFCTCSICVAGAEVAAARKLDFTSKHEDDDKGCDCGDECKCGDNCQCGPQCPCNSDSQNMRDRTKPSIGARKCDCGPECNCTEDCKSGANTQCPCKVMSEEKGSRKKTGGLSNDIVKDITATANQVIRKSINLTSRSTESQEKGSGKEAEELSNDIVKETTTTANEVIRKSTSLTSGSAKSQELNALKDGDNKKESSPHSQKSPISTDPVNDNKQKRDKDDDESQCDICTKCGGMKRRTTDENDRTGFCNCDICVLGLQVAAEKVMDEVHGEHHVEIVILEQSENEQNEDEQECTCGDECKCGENCKCGDQCPCKSGSKRKESISSDAECNCGAECKCGENCRCGKQCPCHSVTNDFEDSDSSSKTQCNCGNDCKCGETCTCGNQCPCHVVKAEKDAQIEKGESEGESEQDKFNKNVGSGTDETGDEENDQTENDTQKEESPLEMKQKDSNKDVGSGNDEDDTVFDEEDQAEVELKNVYFDSVVGLVSGEKTKESQGITRATYKYQDARLDPELDVYQDEVMSVEGVNSERSPTMRESRKSEEFVRSVIVEPTNEASSGVDNGKQCKTVCKRICKYGSKETGAISSGEESEVYSYSEDCSDGMDAEMVDEENESVHEEKEQNLDNESKETERHSKELLSSEVKKMYSTDKNVYQPISMNDKVGKKESNDVTEDHSSVNNEADGHSGLEKHKFDSETQSDEPSSNGYPKKSLSEEKKKLNSKAGVKTYKPSVSPPAIDYKIVGNATTDKEGFVRAIVMKQEDLDSNEVEASPNEDNSNAPPQKDKTNGFPKKEKANPSPQEENTMNHQEPNCKLSCFTEGIKKHYHIKQRLHRNKSILHEDWFEWQEKPENILLVIKASLAQDTEFMKDIVDFVVWANEERDITVFVELKLLSNESAGRNSEFAKLSQECLLFTQSLVDEIHMVVVVGGDGTLLYAASLFPEAVPPVAAFRMGSVNFLIPHTFSLRDMKRVIDNVFSGNTRVHLRERLVCTNLDTKESLNAVNEVVLHRGSDPHMVIVGVALDDVDVITIEGDGIIVSTPVGSTAYCLSAGGAILHPAIPAIEIVPVNPHTLCSRSLVMPQSVKVGLTLKSECRGVPQVAVDGQNSKPIQVGTRLEIQMSDFPLPVIFGDVDSESSENKEYSKTSEWLKSFYNQNSGE